MTDLTIDVVGRDFHARAQQNYIWEAMKKRVKRLETENAMLRAENQRLRDAETNGDSNG